MTNDTVYTFGDGVPNIVIYAGEPSPKKKPGPNGGIPIGLVVIGMIIFSLVFFIETGLQKTMLDPAPTAVITPIPTIFVQPEESVNNNQFRPQPTTRSSLTPCPNGCPSRPSNICRIPIKAIRGSSGQSLYYQPGQTSYDNIVVDPFQGDAWFCEEHDARQHGFTQFKE